MPNMPPKRRPGSRDLPDNLYASQDARNGVTYYRYRDPRTGNYHGMGTDKASAIDDAKALNAVILAGLAQSRIAAIAAPVASSPKLSAVILTHLELCEVRAARGKLAANTLKGKYSHGNAIRRHLGAKPIAEITVKDAADMLDHYLLQDKERAAQAIRSEGIEIFKTAIAKGLVNDNPFAKTLPVEAEVHRARLVLDSFRAIHTASLQLEACYTRMIELAAVTAQRREDLSSVEFKRHRDATAWVESGALWVIQQKKKNRVCIPLTLRLEVLGLEVGEVIARCRDNVLSRYALHHTISVGNCRPGDPLHIDTMSKAFAKARDIVVERDGIFWDANKTPPTLHEIRSLSERLYSAQGGIDTQALLGHRDPRTTSIYKDNRGSEWVKVKTA